MLTPTLSGTIMRRQHGARRRTREDPEKISRLCMLLLNYRIYHAWRLCIACTISRGEGELWGVWRQQFVKILPANKNQIKADRRQMKAAITRLHNIEMHFCV